MPRSWATETCAPASAAGTMSRSVLHEDRGFLGRMMARATANIIRRIPGRHYRRRQSPRDSVRCLKIVLTVKNATAVPAGQSIGSRQEEDMLNAEVLSTLPFSGYGLRVNSYVSASENTMVVTLHEFENR